MLFPVVPCCFCCFEIFHEQKNKKLIQNFLVLKTKNTKILFIFAYPFIQFRLQAGEEKVKTHEGVT